MRFLTLKSHSAQPQYLYFYGLANCIYASDSKIKGLDYLLKPNKNAPQNDAFIRFNNKDELTPTYRQPTQIGEVLYNLNVSHNHSNVYRLQTDNEKYTLNKSSIQALLQKPDLNILLGPALILNMAINRVFFLHASAFILNNKCFIFMADSGTGKSTVAQYFERQKIGSRIADDMLPMCINNQKVQVLAQFPQLKLQQSQQYIGPPVCKKTVFLFAKKLDSHTSIQPINTFDRMKKLINHSVAAKLFSKSELQAHLSFCHQAANLIPGYHVNYQHNPSSLQQLHDLLYEI